MEQIERVFGTIMCNDVVCPVTNLIDVDGDDTNCIDDAVSAVCYYEPDDMWVSFDCDITGIDLLS